MADNEYWPLRRRVDELLHFLVTMHRKPGPAPSPEFRAYKGTNEQYEWLEHPSIEKHKHRMPVQIEDVGVLRMRKLVVLVGDRRDDKTFDLTAAGLEFHDEHCQRSNH